NVSKRSVGRRRRAAPPPVRGSAPDAEQEQQDDQAERNAEEPEQNERHGGFLLTPRDAGARRRASGDGNKSGSSVRPRPSNCRGRTQRDRAAAQQRSPALCFGTPAPPQDRRAERW